MENTNEMQSLIEKVKKKSGFLKWGLGLLGVLLLAPVVWALAYAVLGAAFLGTSLALAAAVGYLVIHYTPVFIMKVENSRINAIIAEAQKNPIPTYWAEHAKDQEEINEFAQGVTDYNTEINNIKTKQRDLSKDLTAEDIQAFSSDIAAMEEDLRMMEADLKGLRENHAKQEIAIKRASAIWDLAQAMNTANAKNRIAHYQDTMSKIKRETAMDAVNGALNRGKAEMRQRLMSRRHAGALAGSSMPALTDARIDGEVITSGGVPVKVQTGS